MNDYFTDEILKELEEIEEKAKFNWRVAHEAERPTIVNENNPLPSWFTRG